MSHFLDRPVGCMPSRLAELYDETSFWSARFGALLFDHLEFRRDIRGLDVGCGTGFPLIELAHVHGGSSHFTGIDIWVDALERARQKRELHGLTNVDIIEADVVSMPFPNANFDLVVSNVGINNFRDPRAALRECRRLARTGARLVLTTNVKGHFGELYALLDAILGESGAGGRSRRSAPRRGTPSLQACNHDGAAMLRHSLVKWFLDGWRQAVGAENEREDFNTLEARLNAVAERDGCVEMMIPMLFVDGIAV
jgi:arsenite methyltransferase